MKESCELSETFNVPASTLYSAWLSSTGHSQMTGGEAECSDKIGEPFAAWDGYITGTNVSLLENKEIVQTWRTSEFAEDDEDSRLVIRFEEQGSGTKVTLVHTHIPEGQTQYEQGWVDHYFTPMKAYFG